MATLLVKVADSTTLSGAQTAIISQHSYLEVVRSFRTFKTIEFKAPSEDQDSIDSIRKLPYVVGATYDKEFSIAPVQEKVETVEFTNDVIEEATASSSPDADNKNTRILTGSGGGTIYVKVANYSGNLRFQFSSTQGGVYSRISTYQGFTQGGTYTFDQADSSNAGHRILFSLTPDGTHKDGTDYTTGVTTAGTPGSSGAYTRITIGASTPSVLYWYNASNSDYGAWDDSPLRYGCLAVHDFWHLDRITKQNRSYLNGQYYTTEEADGVDLYVLDTGVRGASRPTGNNVGLHPELFDVTNNADLNGLSEQQAYRVYEVAGYNSGYTVNGNANSNEDDNGHGTECAVLAGGIKSGVARKIKVYGVKCFSSAGSGSLSGIMNAYQAVINHNDSGHANYKGNTRPAVINASFGPTTPSGAFPYIELNESGTDAGFDIELYDETEKEVVDANIVLVRSAGNGFKDSGDNFAGPLQTRFKAGARSSGYQDGDVNIFDVNIPSISVGATDYNDRWADFSNYGSGCTTTAPGQHITCPAYDWTTNTTYTSVSNYVNIGGTSFSGPIVAGVVCQFIGANDYLLTTNTLPTLCKNWVRQSGGAGKYNAISSEAYPINSAKEIKLPDNPFEVSNGSNQVKVSFNSADSSEFLNRIGKKIQLRTPSMPTVGGINIGDATRQWHGIIAQDPSNNNITIQLTNSGTSDATGGGSGNYMAVISDTHEVTDGPTFANVALYAELDSEEAGHTGRTVDQLPVDTGVDFNFQDTGSLLSKVRGLFTKYINKSIAWHRSPGGLHSTGGPQTESGRVWWKTTGATAGTYYAQCTAHTNMYGTINLSGSGGSAIRKWNVTDAGNGAYNFAEQNVASTSLMINVTNTGSSDYTISGTDRDTTHSSAADPGIKVWIGDTVTFAVNATGHPFYLKTQAGTGTGNQISSGVSGQGSEVGNVVWNTTGATAGTYYYQCEFHGGMVGSITLAQPGESGDDITINSTIGDVLVFDVNATGHPFVIKDTQGSGTSNQVTSGVGGDGFANSSVKSIQAGINTFTSYASEPFNIREYTITGDSLSGTGLSLNTTTGELSGTVTSSYQDGFYLVTVNELTSGESQSYNFHTTGTGVVVTIGSQPQNANIEAGAGTNATFGPLNASTSDSSTITYKWQYTTGGSWADISSLAGHSGETTDTLTVDDDYAYNGWQYRCVCDSNTAANTTTTNAATLTVYRTITVDTQPTAQSAVAPAAATFTAAGSTADTAAVTYQWEKSEDDTAWHVISGATNNTYTTTATTYDQGGTPPGSFDADHNDYFRVKINAVGASEVTSNSAILTVTRTITITDQPDNETGSIGGTRTFTVAATLSDGDNSDVVFQWQLSIDDGSNWSNIGGATSASYTTPTLTNQMDEYQYRCFLSAPGATNVISNAAVLQVETVQVSVTAHPTNQSADETGTVTFTCAGTVDNSAITALLNSSFGVGNWVTPSGGGASAKAETAADPELYNSIWSDHTPTLTYQWEKSDDGGSNWSSVAGATSDSYTTNALTYADDHDDQYRCVLDATGADAAATTNAATVTVYRTHQITTQPINATGNEGGTVTYTVAGSTSSGSHTYQWQKSDDTVNYNNIPGATAATYQTPSLVFATDNEDRFKCVLSLVGAQTSLTSTYANLTVLRVITISAQPQDATVIEGNAATFNITAAITSGTINYQWQNSTDSGANWSNIIGATSASYTTQAMPFPTVNNQYRCVLSNSNAISITSDAANITVNESEFVSPPSTISVNIDTDTTLAYNRQPTFTTAAFNSQYAGSTHYATYWLVKRVSDNTVVYDTSQITVPDLSAGDTVNLTTFTVPSGYLDFDTTYSAQAKYKDNAGLVSSYGNPTVFKTPVVDQPVIQAFTPAFNPTINVITPAIKGGYGHNSTDWQFSQAETFLNIEHQSLGNSTNLLQYTLPGDVNLLPTTTYYVRVRFNVDTV
tara:strand:- start:3722 stop:9553 length:5832 start_codon:yes stop_codon:yes gene_type:complete